MAEMIEKVEPAEQAIDVEAQDPLVTEYTELGQQAAQAEYNDMAEYYARKKQALIEERQEYYRQKHLDVQAEMNAHQNRVHQWKISNTTTYGLPKYASGWEAEAKSELKNNGVTDWYKYAANQADIAWEKELKEKSER